MVSVTVQRTGLILSLIFDEAPERGLSWKWLDMDDIAEIGFIGGKPARIHFDLFPAAFTPDGARCIVDVAPWFRRAMESLLPLQYRGEEYGLIELLSQLHEEDREHYQDD